jgi:DNA-directed RNA polymerase specialized sigma24 family protein
MSPDESVTEWIAHLKQGDQAAAQHLWERYFRRLADLARARLAAAPRRAADEEDVALSAFDSFCRAAERGRFPRLSDRDNLWPLLVVLTARKAADLANHERRQKRGGVVRGEGGPDGLPDRCGDCPGLEEIVGREPTPAFAAEVADEWERLLARLGDEELRTIATLKVEGYTDREVADRVGCVERTVRRRVALIRKFLQAEAAR